MRPARRRGTCAARSRSRRPPGAALADTQLRRNLGHATGTIRAKRAAVVAEVPDWEELRLAGEAIKAATMARLDEHLVSSWRARSPRAAASVHWARDANEANRIVTELVQADRARPRWSRSSRWPPRRSGSTRRSPAAGIGAWETDLAELIVQLGDDRPSHILVPAIHRNRAEIREIFLREMAGVDPALTDDPPAAGRGRPRRTCGASSWPPGSAVCGANFAVAETGTLAVVESEGNGRMCLTLPETLITVMGIEKVVPTWARPRGVPAAAAALVDRRADEPVHLDVDRRDPRRRAAGVPPRAARQRPHRGAGRRGRPTGAALHPVLGLPQRLPGVRAHRRARVRLGLSRADRRGAVARS